MEIFRDSLQITNQLINYVSNNNIKRFLKRLNNVHLIYKHPELDVQRSSLSIPGIIS